MKERKIIITTSIKGKAALMAAVLMEADMHGVAVVCDDRVVSIDEFLKIKKLTKEDLDEAIKHVGEDKALARYINEIEVMKIAQPIKRTDIKTDSQHPFQRFMKNPKKKF